MSDVQTVAAQTVAATPLQIVSVQKFVVDGKEFSSMEEAQVYLASKSFESEVDAYLKENDIAQGRGSAYNTIRQHLLNFQGWREVKAKCEAAGA